MQIENKNYKDTVFRLLFSDKKRLLELYNAINNTKYTNADDLTINTLEGDTFLNMKNDVSFIFSYDLSLFEHQSSPCPNIPLRDLFYVASLYKDMIPIAQTYKAQVMEIPNPKFVVFYNGTTPMEDRKNYRLSDMFMNGTTNPQLELVVTVYNINEGHNAELMQACSTIKSYSLFVSKVRKYIEKGKKKYNEIHKECIDILDTKRAEQKEIVREAIAKAIDECVADNILKDFFLKNREEVIEVGVLGYSAEKHLQVIQEESYTMGLQDKEKELQPIIEKQSKTIEEKDLVIEEKEQVIEEQIALLQKYKEKYGDI